LESIREFSQTRIITPTKLNNLHAQVRVTSGLIKEGGIFTPNYITYLVETGPLGWQVRRKDADFYTLRKDLVRQFPHLLVPPLPAKSNKLSEGFMRRRERYYTRFLQAVCRSETLKASNFLVDFLQVDDLKLFQKIVKDQEKVKYGKALTDLVMQTGQARVQPTEQASKFSGKMLDYIDSYQILYKEIVECSKEIHDLS